MSKINKFQIKAATIEAIGGAYHWLESQRDYCCDYKTDDEGNNVYDESGEVVKIPPAEGSYNYANYIGYVEALKILDGLKL